MARTWEITAEELTEESFAPYGRIVAVPETPAPRSGEGWACWYGFAQLDNSLPINMGVVVSRVRPVVVEDMERHVHTFELLYPHGDDLVQPLALPLDLENPDAAPDPATVKAFRIPVGKAIIMHPGTWHSCAIPVARDTTYGFACGEPDYDYVPDWVPFPEGDTVRVTVAQ